MSDVGRLLCHKGFVLVHQTTVLSVVRTPFSDGGERNELAMSSADDSYLWLWILLISMAHERACLLSQRREQTT